MQMDHCTQARDPPGLSEPERPRSGAWPPGILLVSAGRIRHPAPKCQVICFLFYHALGSYMAGGWDEMKISKSAGQRGSDSDETPWQSTLERSFELANLPSLYDILERARNREGEVTVYACSNSTQHLSLDSADAKTRVDEIVGLSTMLHVTSGECHVLYL